MAEQRMDVDTDSLAAAASRCVDSGRMAAAGANRLADNSPIAGMFGAFAEAHSFQQIASAAHQAHVNQLRGHHRALTGLGEKGHAAATRFTATDESSADSIGLVEAAFEAH